jgi:WD40 repeat protein
MRLFRPGLVLGLALLPTFAGVAPASAQHAKDRAKTEVVPNIPHSDGVTSVAFSPDGARILSSGGHDNTIKLWDVATGALLRTFRGHSGWVSSAAFSPDGVRILSGSSDKTLKLWDAATGRLIRTFRGHAETVYSVAFSPDGTRLVSGGETVKLWDAKTGQSIHTFKEEGRAVAFSPDGARVLSGGNLWDAKTGELIRTFEKHGGDVLSVAFSPDGTRLVSAADKTFMLRDAATGELIRTFERHGGSVLSVAFSPDGRFILSGGWDEIKLWDAATSQLVRTFKGGVGIGANLTFSPNGTLVLAGPALWDAASGRMIRTLGEGADTVRGVMVSPDGSRLLSGGDDKTLKLWDAASGRLIRTLEGHAESVMSVAFSPDGTRLLSGSSDTTFKLWDAASGQLIRTFEPDGLGVDHVAFSSDGTRVLSANPVNLWDAASGQLIRNFGGYIGALSPDGTRVLSGANEGLSLWDAKTGRLIWTSKGQIQALAFSPDGKRFLSVGMYGTMLELRDAATGRVIRPFRGHTDFVVSVAFSADGKRLLSGSWDKTLTLWDTAAGRPIRTFQGHVGMVNSVAFSLDGKRIVSGSYDTTIRIWDASTGHNIDTLIGGRDSRWLSLTSAGFFAGSGSANELLGIVRGLDVTTLDQVHQSLFNPDLVREALAGDPNGEVRDAAKVINLEKVLDSGPAPSVAIASPAAVSQSAADLVDVTARIEDRGKGVGRVEWRVNGITAAVAAKPDGEGPVYTVPQKLALDPGDNTIEVVAYNGSNLLASLPARTTIKFTGPADKNKPKLHILAIGINEYEDKGWTPPGSTANFFFERLDLAVDDAKAFGASMKKAAAGLYDEVLVTEGLDQDATRENLPKIVGEVAAKIHPRDTFILFAAGHGYSMKTNGRFYLIPQDYQGGPNPEALATRAIGQDQLQDWLATKRIKAKRALILLDTCESGALIAGHARSRADVPASEAAVGRLHEATGRPVLTAAALGQSAQEGEIDASGETHGLFTWAVLDALRKGDSNGNGQIELSELVAHVQSAIPKIVSGKGGSGQAVTSKTGWDKQSARFGSRGEDFVVGRRLP